MEFQDAKKELLQLAKNAGAYCEQYKLAIKSETPAELMNDLHSNKPAAGKWLSNEELSDIADGLLFEDRILLRLEHLYQTCGQTNGLEMFDLINARLEAIQKGFDKEIIDSHRGEDRVVRFHYELLPDGTEKMMTMKDMRETTGFPIITYFPKYFNKAETSHISWVNVEWVKNEVLIFKAKKVLAEARGLLLSIAPPVATSTEPKEIFISDENIEPIYSALVPYFKGQETKLRQLLEGRAISVIKNDAYWCVTNKANPSGVVGSE